jgi:radical SAM protein with 4Fe4S-binding SPASM domain
MGRFSGEIMEREFDVTEKINLPSSLHTKIINDLYIVIAPCYPNWIVLDKQEYELLQYFQRDTIIDSMLLFKKIFDQSDDKTLEIAKKLLKKIESARFYFNSKIKSEDKIGDITKKIQLNLTNNCNLRCNHCFLSAGKEVKNELEMKKLIPFLDEIFCLTGKTDVVVSGGEPLVYDNIFAVLKYLKQKGHTVILFSNGTLIDKKNISLLKEYVDEIQLSMEGISKNCYESIRGKNNYCKLLEAINLIRLNNIQLTLAITALDEVLEDIENYLLNFIERLNINTINVRINGEIEKEGNAIYLNESNFHLNYEKETKLKKILKILSEKNYCVETTHIRNIHFSNCGIGTNIVINYDGKIYPCSYFKKDFFDMNDTPSRIVSEFDKLNELTSVDRIVYCKNCELLYICNGGCKIKNFIQNGSYTKPYCTNEMKEKKYLSLIANYVQDSL